MAVRPVASLAAPAGPPNLAFEPGSVDFGLQPVNSNPTQATLQLRNDGAEGVLVESLKIVGGGSESFWVGENTCWGTFLEPAQTCWVQVYFSPRDGTEYNVQLQASANSYQFNAGLTGTGARAILAAQSGSVDFGVAKVGSVGTTREIEVSNIGNWPGGAFIAVIAGGAIGSFDLIDENCTGVELVPAATCTLQVRFQPVSEGVKKAMLGLFGENDGPTPIVLTGVGAAPDPALAQPSAFATGPMTANAGPTGRPRPRSHRRRVRIHRRHRRVALDSARISQAR